MRKKRTDHSWGTGMVERISGHPTNTKPGPEAPQSHKVFLLMIMHAEKISRDGSPSVASITLLRRWWQLVAGRMKNSHSVAMPTLVRHQSEGD